MRIAFDLGGVIGPRYTERQLPDGTFGMLPGPNVGSIEVLRWCAQRFSPSNLFIISRVSRDNGQTKIDGNWAWLRHWGITDIIPEPNIVVFAGEKEDKKGYAEKLAIDVMVDDSYECLASMPNNVYLVAFLPQTKIPEVWALLKSRKGIIALDWGAIREIFRHSYIEG